MKNEEQIIAIAKMCGWTHTKTIHNPNTCPYGRHPVHTADVTWDLPLPDYLSDLNAMHEVEKVLTWEQRKPYHNTLVDVAGFSYCEADTTEETELDWNCRLCHATAAQRAEAFLRTLNLWRP